MQALLPGLWQMRLRDVNAYLLDSLDGLILIDCGNAGQTGDILAAFTEQGRAPEDLRHILVSHCHPNHAGGLAKLQRLTGAQTWMHPLDAELVRTGLAFHPAQPGPGWLNRILYQSHVRNGNSRLEAARVDHELSYGERLPFLDLQVVHSPGHTAGQVAFLWAAYGGVLFAADATVNIPFLRESIFYEDRTQGAMTLRKLANLSFGYACFGHGIPIRQDAGQRFRRKRGNSNPGE